MLQSPYYLQHTKTRDGLYKQMYVVLVETHEQYLEVAVFCDVGKNSPQLLFNLIVNHLPPVLTHKYDMITQTGACVVDAINVYLIRSHNTANIPKKF